MGPVFTTDLRQFAQSHRTHLRGRAQGVPEPGAVFLTGVFPGVTRGTMTGQRKIGVLMGGLSAERDVSLRSGEAILTALTDRGHDAWPLFVDRDVDLVLRQARIDVAFLALHGRYGEDGCIQGMLELLGIPYTGSGVLASALAMNKAKAKEVFRLNNLPTAPGYLVEADGGEDILDQHGAFGFPVVVKPCGEGSSFGTRIARDEL